MSSASKRRVQVLKDCQKATTRAERATKRAEDAILKKTACKDLIIENWKISKEGRIFLGGACLEASEVVHVEALQKVWVILEEVSHDLPWSVVEDAMAAIFKVEVATPREEDDDDASKEDDRVSATGDLEG